MILTMKKMPLMWRCFNALTALVKRGGLHKILPPPPRFLHNDMQNSMVAGGFCLCAERLGGRYANH